ncbi:hypothetical protein OPV22_000742 [Ensete ventricosum]|uniref:PRA1 family protein n=1 Tax=Ensete ventricosum TaxID=4639 RepID=A0AAV8RTN9_ENSVE|nr:hypothetical protein OPV22_000742 [Ensete ventricosum]
MVGGVPKMQKTSPPAYAPNPTPSLSAWLPAMESPAPLTRSVAAAPSSSPSPAARTADLVSRFKEQGKGLIAAQRPWPQLLDTTALSRPANTGEAVARLRRNLAYFRSNYALFAIAALSASLLWHPASLVAFVALVAAWFLLYFSRDQPLVLFGRLIEDGTVLGALSVATVVVLLFSAVGSTVFGALMVGAALVCLHAVFRATDDLFLDEAEVASGGLGVPAFGIPVQPQAYVRIV